MLRLSTLGPRRAPRPVRRVLNPQISNVSTTGLYPTNEYIDVSYSERIILTSSLSNTDSSALIRLVFYDSSYRFLGYSDLLTIEAYDLVDLNDGSRKAASLYVVANEMGASYVKVYLVQNVHNGNLVMYVSQT